MHFDPDGEVASIDRDQRYFYLFEIVSLFEKMTRETFGFQRCFFSMNFRKKTVT